MNRRLRNFYITLTLAIWITSSGCLFFHQSSPAKLLEQSPGIIQWKTELIFGMSRKDGTTVKENEWDAFLSDVVTPRFPDGFTVLDGSGQYKNKEGQLIRENSRIILILHPAEEPANSKLEEIREAYKKQFDQESVLRVTTVSKTSF